MKKVIVLDTEGISGKRPYNIGYLIGDLHGNIYVKRSFACMPCIWENLESAIRFAQENVREMTHKNIQEIFENPDNKYTWANIDEIREIFISDIISHGITEIWAYNCNFDKNGLKRLFGYDFFDRYKVNWLDIWSAIVMTKCLSKKFVKFCKANNLVTENGNCKTSAEAVTAYLENDPNFTEEHTALSDCLLEYKLLIIAKKTKKKIDGKVCQPWRLVKNFCEVNGL